MTEIDHSTRVIRTMIRLADTLVDDFDVMDLLQGLAEESGDLMNANATGILLADPDGQLEVAASSDDSANIVELLQVSAGAGPCVDAYRNREVVSVGDVADASEWPDFREAALSQGFHAVHAVPLRLRKATIGSLNVFRDTPGEWSHPEHETAQALADMATIGILQSRALDEAQQLGRQLQHALDSRIVIEQAKGFVAYRRDVSLGEAFTLIRGWARESRTPLSEVARRIVERTLEV